MKNKRLSFGISLLLSAALFIGAFLGNGQIVHADPEPSYAVYILLTNGERVETTVNGYMPDWDAMAFMNVHATPGIDKNFSYDVATKTLIIDSAICGNDNDGEDHNGNGVLELNMMELINAKGILGKGTSDIEAERFDLSCISDNASKTLKIDLEPGATLTLHNVEVGGERPADNRFVLGEEVVLTKPSEDVFVFSRKAGADVGTEIAAKDGNTYIVLSNDPDEVALKSLAANTSGSVTIPDTAEIKGKSYKVTEVMDGALKDNVNITSVTIGKNVKKIGKEAMAGCTGLTSVDLGSPDEIGEGALSNCAQLTNVKIPETIKKISANMMAGCSGLTSVDLGSVEEIGEGALSKCKKLKKVTIPATTKKIGKNAFKDDSKLTNLTINAKSLKTVDKNAIRNINPKAKITIKGTKKQQKVVVKLISKKSTGYKKTMKIKKAK